MLVVTQTRLDPREENVDWGNIDFDICVMASNPQSCQKKILQTFMVKLREAVSKLTELGVVKVVQESNRDPDGKFVDLKEVFDWRHRNGKWQRRCRIVARDFKTVPSTSVLKHFHQRRLEEQFDLSFCSIWYMAGRCCQWISVTHTSWFHSRRCAMFKSGVGSKIF